MTVAVFYYHSFFGELFAAVCSAFCRYGIRFIFIMSNNCRFFLSLGLVLRKHADNLAGWLAGWVVSFCNSIILSIIYHAVAKNPSSVPPSWIYRLQKALSPLKESPFLQGNRTKSCYPEPHLFFYENFANQLSYYHIRLLTTVSQYVKK